MYSAANMDLHSTSVSTPAATLDLYPSEEPKKPELVVWLDRNGAILQRSGHGPIMRDEIPPGLHQLAFQKDMPDIASLSAEDRAKNLDLSKQLSTIFWLRRTRAKRSLRSRPTMLAFANAKVSWLLILS